MLTYLNKNPEALSPSFLAAYFLDESLSPCEGDNLPQTFLDTLSLYLGFPL